MLEALIPILIRRVVIPEVASLLRKEPNLTDVEIIQKLSDDVQVLVTSNQAFLDSIRTAAGK